MSAMFLFQHYLSHIAYCALARLHHVLRKCRVPLSALTVLAYSWCCYTSGTGGVCM